MKTEQHRSSIKVLLIEDDEDDYVLIRDLLSEIHAVAFDLSWAATYREAVEAIESSGYDVCLLDYLLGVQTGLDLLSEASSKDWKTPIIFLTGQGEYEVDVKAMKAGAADYLVKDTLNAPLLERSIRYAIDRWRDRQALQEAHDALEKKVAERTADLEAANTELKRVSEKIKLFAYSVSHDLKSPAFGLYGLAKRMLEGHSEMLDEKGKAYCVQIMQAAEQIASLAEKINMFIASKETPLTIEELDVNQVILLIREEFSERLIVRNIALNGPDQPIPCVRADRLSLIRILRNLVDNALKYGGDSLSRIRIGVEESSQTYVFSVSDDGLGLDKNDSKDVFGLFTRKKSSKGVEGAGLGLAIVKEIVERHDGTVWVERGSSSKGFKICFSILKSL